MPDKRLIFTGARARILIDGVPAGFTRSVDGSETYQFDAVEILDNIEVQEFVPVAYRTTLSASIVWVVTETLRQKQFLPAGGTSSAERLLNAVNQKELNVLVEDNVSSAPIALWEQAKCTTNSLSIAAGAIVYQNMEFVCIRMKDRSEI